MNRKEYARFKRGKSVILLDYFTLKPIAKYETLEECAEDMMISPSSLSGALSKYQGFPIGYLHKEMLAFVYEHNLDKLVAIQSYNYADFMD